MIWLSRQRPGSKQSWPDLATPANSATAAGLFVAIPAVVAYNYYQRQVKSILQSLDSVKELCLAYAKRKG